LLFRTGFYRRGRVVHIGGVVGGDDSAGLFRFDGIVCGSMGLGEFWQLQTSFRVPDLRLLHILCLGYKEYLIPSVQNRWFMSSTVSNMHPDHT